VSDPSIKTEEATEHLKGWRQRVKYGTLTITARDGLIVHIEEHNTWKSPTDLPNTDARATGRIPGVLK